jgi:ribosomal protein L3 glutamine methyltransferase
MNPTPPGSDRLRRSTQALRTLGDWLQWAEAAYARHDVFCGQVADNAHDEALYLLLRTLDLPLDSRPSVLRRVLRPEQHQRLQDVMVRRILERVPAGYLTGETWLGGHRFTVDERVLIPRSYFVELLPGLAEHFGGAERIREAVDVCTGSGCLAILMAQAFPRARVDAVDLSPDALEVARINVRDHRLTERVHLHRSDVFDAVPLRKYDLILSNPPYEPSAICDDLPPEFRQEPRLALDGGQDGLDIIRKLLRQARDRLSPDGLVVIEVGGLQEAMERAFADLGIQWLETADGSNCVCAIQARHLRRRR